MWIEEGGKSTFRFEWWAPTEAIKVWNKNFLTIFMQIKGKNFRTLMFFVSNFIYNMSACMDDFVIFLWKFFSSSWRGSSSSVDYAKHFFNIELDFCPPSPSSPSSSLWHMQIIKRVSELSSLGDGEDEVKEKSEKREMKNFFWFVFLFMQKKNRIGIFLSRKRRVWARRRL